MCDYVVRRGMAMAAVGACVGLLAWYRALPFVADVVEGIDTAGGSVPAAVLLVVGATSLLATVLPGVGAARVDPVSTLDAR